VVVLGLIAAGLLVSPVRGESETHLTVFGFTLPTVCFFRRTTGLPCAGCGITRAVVLLLHGRWSESVAMHPFGLPVLGMALLALPPRAAALAGRAGRATRLWDRLWLRSGIVLFVALFIWWAVRIGPTARAALALRFPGLF
jgi:hypothetical protein